MKVLVTGAGGFLGRGLIVPFVGKHELRLMDVADWDTPHEKIVGDVADLDTVHKAVEGCQAIVIAHMASRQAGSYEMPTLPFDANVKGTANLFFEGVKAGIKKYVLISGEVVVMGHKVPRRLDMPLKTGSIYGLTKVCQEVIAEQFQRENNLQVASLRVGYILSADDPNHVVDKYGKHIQERNPPNTDRRDIGLAALRALELPDLAYEKFFILGTPEAGATYEMEPSYQRLGWKPQYDFTWLPLPKSLQKPQP
jgi:nucleoside-diphosphate-sugar epimerase